MFFTSFSISHRFILACHFLAFVFCLNCCNLPYCHIFSNLVFFTNIFIFHYVTYVCLLRLMPLCKTCFDCIFIPLHLTKWAVAHESLCSNNKNSQFQCTIFCFCHFICYGLRDMLLWRIGSKLIGQLS